MKEKWEKDERGNWYKEYYDEEEEEETTESRLWKYWVSEEMARGIYWNNVGDCPLFGGDNYFYASTFQQSLSKILKKEWFR